MVVVVVVVDPLVLDWAKARPVDNAIMADAKRSRVILISYGSGNVPSIL